jgi:hypothetical protein
MHSERLGGSFGNTRCFHRRKEGEMSNKTGTILDSFIESICKGKPIGTAVVFTEQGCFEIDNNFKPPRVKKVDIKSKEEE